MANAVCVLQKISYAFQQCKNFENRLTFDKVTESLEVGTFLRHSVHFLKCMMCCVFGCVVVFVVFSVRLLRLVHCALLLLSRDLMTERLTVRLIKAAIIQAYLRDYVAFDQSQREVTALGRISSSRTHRSQSHQFISSVDNDGQKLTKKCH